MSEVKQNSIWVHCKSTHLYVVKSFPKVKPGGEWEAGVLYQSAGFEGDEHPSFVRSRVDFLKKFKELT